MRIRTIGMAVVLVAGLLRLTAAAAGEEPPVQAVWKLHEETFTFMGITSHYSCDGLAGQLKALLREAGARDDLKVSSPCVDPLRGVSAMATGGVSAMSTARVSFYALAPATAAAPVAVQAPEAPARRLGKDVPPLKAGPRPDEAAVGAWKTVQLRAGKPRGLEPGDCELVEQFGRTLLKSFTTRNSAAHMNCVPHQITLGGIDLRFDVLAALPPAEQARVRPAQ